MVDALRFYLGVFLGNKPPYHDFRDAKYLSKFDNFLFGGISRDSVVDEDDTTDNILSQPHASHFQRRLQIQISWTVLHEISKKEFSKSHTSLVPRVVDFFSKMK